jgi:hypothetical protein
MRKRLAIVMLISFSISACGSPIPVKNVNNDEGCIPPLYNIAFPSVTQAPEATPRHIPPQKYWQQQDSLPQQKQDTGISLVGRLSQRELWFISPISHKVNRYFIENRQWKSYKTIDSTQAIPRGLFISNDGTVWGIGIYLTDNNDIGKSFPLLSRYNDQIDGFEFVMDQSVILQTPQVFWNSGIVEDKTGLLWLFVEGKGGQILYSFDPKTQQATQHYSMSSGGNSTLVIDPDGNLWFLDVFENNLMQYNPVTQEANPYKGLTIPIDLQDVSYLYSDRSERLWLDTHGWLDFSNKYSLVWNRVIESPVFITDNGIPESHFLLSTPIDTYQSSNGWYWFTGTVGIVRLDLQQGSWCLITTGRSTVIEDIEHNLWIAVFGHLYKYELKH